MKTVGRWRASAIPPFSFSYWPLEYVFRKKKRLPDSVNTQQLLRTALAAMVHDRHRIVRLDLAAQVGLVKVLHGREGARSLLFVLGVGHAVETGLELLADVEHRCV